jgi:hypothetical protein
LAARPAGVGVKAQLGQQQATLGRGAQQVVQLSGAGQQGALFGAAAGRESGRRPGLATAQRGAGTRGPGFSALDQREQQMLGQGFLPRLLYF